MGERITLCANARPHVGGQGVNLAQMISAFSRLGDVEVWARGGDGVRVVPARTGRIFSLPGLRRRRDWSTLASDLEVDAWCAQRIGARHRGHGGVVQGVVGQSAWTLGAARRAGARTVLDCVNHHVDDLREHVGESCRRFGIRSFVHPAMVSRIRREYQTADSIRVMSERSRRTFLERGLDPERVVVARPPIDVDAAPLARFDSDVFRIMFVGLLEPWKGFDFLIDAFLSARIEDAVLELWGGPGSRPVSRFLSAARSRSTRIVVRPESVQQLGLEQTYARASVLVHPSLTDGFGLVVAEAMSCGVPVIVGHNVGAAELVVDGESGYVVDPRDVSALRDRLEHLAHHPAELRRMGANARARAATLGTGPFESALRSAAGLS